MSGIDFREHTTLGRTGLEISRIGLAGGYKVPAKAVERAFDESGVNYFYWETRRPEMGQALRELTARRRDDLVIAIQTYARTSSWLRRSVEKALRKLKIDRAEILYLGWRNKMPSRRILDAAQGLRQRGLIGFLGFSGHDRLFHGEMAAREDSPFDVQMIRYNAAHRGAEKEIFEGMAENPPGIAIYTATRWGKLMKAKKMPPGEKPLTASECYRFVLSHPAVDLCNAGPRTEEEMVEGLRALEEGPLSPEEMDRIRKIGDHVHG